MRALLKQLLRAYLAGVWMCFAEPSLSNYYGLQRNPGYDGMLVDQNDYEAESFVNTQALAINFGFAVARDASSSQNTSGSNPSLMPCKAPTADTDVIIGIALRHAILPTLGRGDGGTNLVNFPQYQPVPVCKRGNIFKVPFENVTAEQQVCSITAQNGALGSVENTPLPSAVAAALGHTQATGTITISTNPVVGDTITLNGIVFTFIANGATPADEYHVALGTTAALTAAALQAVLDANNNAAITVAEYTVSGAVVTITYFQGGTGGNAYTMVTSDATDITLSAATLTGGTGNTGNATIALAGQPTQITAASGVYRIVCTAATTANVFRPNGEFIGTLTFGTQFNDEIVVTITAGGTACVAGDSFEVTVAVATGRVPIRGAYWQQTGTPGGNALQLRINM